MVGGACSPPFNGGEQMNIGRIKKHLSNGGQLWRIAGRDRFFYKMDGDKLLCRVNELGGWHDSCTSLDKLQTYPLNVALKDYDYKNWERKVIETPSLQWKSQARRNRINE